MVATPLLLWSCLGCCWLLHSQQHAEAYLACWCACSDVLSVTEGLRTLVPSSLPAPYSAAGAPGHRCTRARQDRSESFLFFNILVGTHTVRVLILTAHACASLHARTRRHMRSRPTDSHMPRRRSMWPTWWAVQIELSSLSHDHCALLIDQWAQGSGYNGPTVADGATMGLEYGLWCVCCRRLVVALNLV